jgi:hypothetical protein
VFGRVEKKIIRNPFGERVEGFILKDGKTTVYKGDKKFEKIMIKWRKQKDSKKLEIERSVWDE